MADRYWVDDDVSGLWNAANNWAAASGGAGGAGVPGAADKAIFDGANVTNCRLDAAMNITELSALGAYTGTIDGATDDLNHAISGDCTLACTRVDMGDGTWTVGGNFNNSAATTFNSNDSTLDMTGAAKVLTPNGGAGKFLANVTISGTISLGASLRIDYGEVLDVSGTLTANSNILILGAADCQVTGTITGSATLQLDDGGKITQQDGTIDIATLLITRANGTVLDSGTYASATVDIRESNGASESMVFSSGTYTFTGNVTFQTINAGSILVVGNGTNNPNFVFQGNVTITEGVGAGAVTWTKGTGTITLSGATAGIQTINFFGKAVEDLVVNDIGATKQFTGTVVTDSFLLTAGTIDHNGQGFETVGDYTVDSGSNFTNTGMDGSTIVVGGNLLVRGNAGNNIAWNATAAWTLTVTGTANCFFVNAANSDASGGTTIDADDTTCTDGGSNTNWDFVPLAGVAIPNFVSNYDAFDILGISAATTVTAATTKLTVTVTPGTGETIFLFDVSGFYDDASTGVGIIYDGIAEIGRFSMGNHTGEPWESEKGIKLSGNLVILVPAGAAGKGHLSYNYKSAEAPSVLPIAVRPRRI